jgi:metal iron transporter
VLSEIAIISTDLAELLGSAIGLCLIFPKLPLWAGVVLTAVDVLVFLAFSDPSSGQGRPVRLFELVITVLVGLSLSIIVLFN